VGPEHCILSSDLGQAGNLPHPDGLEAFFAALRSQGFSVAEIERMAKTNPAKLLGMTAR
jgi:microsomal dipeptidase-like Zn-dependent dipeptidase